MRITFNVFSQRGTDTAHNEDAVLLDGKVQQGRVRERGEVDTSQPRYFAVADGVSNGTLPSTASRRLLELLQTRLETISLSPVNGGVNPLKNGGGNWCRENFVCQGHKGAL
ncbi:MAG: hypothetical protein WA012_12565 [Rhodoferax sp.]